MPAFGFVSVFSLTFSFHNTSAAIVLSDETDKILKHLHFFILRAQRTLQETTGHHLQYVYENHHRLLNHVHWGKSFSPTYTYTHLHTHARKSKTSQRNLLNPNSKPPGYRINPLLPLIAKQMTSSPCQFSFMAFWNAVVVRLWISIKTHFCVMAPWLRVNGAEITTRSLGQQQNLSHYGHVLLALTITEKWKLVLTSQKHEELSWVTLAK